jgi:integration host factor subunit alpha
MAQHTFLVEIGTAELPPKALRSLAEAFADNFKAELTKADLADLLFDRLGLNKRESKDMVEAFFDIMQTALISGRDVKMSGFGNFNIRRKAPRPGRNPRTGEAIPIKARNVVTFHASHKLKGAVQGDTLTADDFE